MEKKIVKQEEKYFKLLERKKELEKKLYSVEHKRKQLAMNIYESKISYSLINIGRIYEKSCIVNRAIYDSTSRV
jgi:hypothetical protein